LGANLPTGAAAVHPTALPQSAQLVAVADLLSYQ
jgi:hypothetical protein